MPRKSEGSKTPWRSILAGNRASERSGSPFLTGYTASVFSRTEVVFHQAINPIKVRFPQARLPFFNTSQLRQKPQNQPFLVLCMSHYLCVYCRCCKDDFSPLPVRSMLLSPLTESQLRHQERYLGISDMRLRGSLCLSVAWEEVQIMRKQILKQRKRLPKLSPLRPFLMVTNWESC